MEIRGFLLLVCQTDKINNMKKDDIPYELLAKYLSERCTSEERKDMESWINANPEHTILFNKLSAQWKNVQEDAFPLVIPDKVRMWQKIQATIRMKTRHARLYSRNVLFRVSGIAATITLIIGFAFASLFNQHDSNHRTAEIQNTVIAPAGQKSQVILPDGTKVWLNSGSKLSYNSQADARERIVFLKGEAYFDVTKNKEKPFIVKTEIVNVKVLGTAFNVSAYKKEKDVRIALERGRVQVLSPVHGKMLATLSPNHAASISRSNLLCQVTTCDAKSEACWHDNVLIFDGTQTAEMWNKLSRWYGVDINIEGKSKNNKYWYKIKTESLTELLNMINIITPIEYKLNGEEVYIRYK